LGENPQFDDPNNFDFDVGNSNLMNTGSNPVSLCNEIGLCSNFVESIPADRIFPYIPLTVHSASYDASGAAGTIDDQASTYTMGSAWHSDDAGGWIIYQVNNGPKTIKWIGLSAGSKTKYYSPNAFQIQVSTTGTQEEDFTTVLSTNRVDNYNNTHTSMTQWYEIPNASSASYIRLYIDNSFRDNTSTMTNPEVQVVEFYAIGPGEGDESTGSPSPPAGLTIISQ